MIYKIMISILFTAFWPVSNPVSELSSASNKINMNYEGSEHVDLEPWTYTEDFEDRELGAWASYPLWQDIAYNQNFRVNEMVPGDPNISIVQKVTPYTAVDNYAGAQKLLDMYLVAGATLKFRFYLKTNQKCDWYKVRFAAGELGKLDVTITDVVTNQWNWVTLSYEDFLRENASLGNKEAIKIYALAFLTKISDADPAMPIYLGIDDVSFSAARRADFSFLTPGMHKLPEFQTYIPKEHYYQGSQFNLSGTWSALAKRVTLSITPYTNEEKIVYQDTLHKSGESWNLQPFKIDFPAGLYLATLKAYDIDQISHTQFTLHIARENIAGQHPRLLFNATEKKEIDRRFTSDRFREVLDNIVTQAREQREKIPVESLHFDLDQFPDEDWLHSWDSWGGRIYHTGTALRLNARAYAFHQDKEAGAYVKGVLLTLASWPNWTHPWQTKRGRYSEHRTGSWAHRVAEAYDLVYDFMTEEERSLIRKAVMKNIVEGVHRTYIYNDNITAATSNWLAMTVGGSLMCMSAVYDDGADTKNLEPYFTGAIMKLDRFLNRVTDSKDGAWGEGYGYNNYSFSNLSYSLPSIENVFGVDLSKPLIGTYNEYIWAGLIKDRTWFEYGDSKGHLTAATNWAYLLSKYKEPRLSWFYNYLGKKEDSPDTDAVNRAFYEDVVFNIDNIPAEDPFNENPVKLFREIGTTVFKSGWEKDDFAFVMRTGPAYNHQHLDQGSFWLADRGEIFVQERSLGNSHYYDDPIYESWLTQPVGHSTILVNGNHQSQRTGDHEKFAPGFDDYAFVSHFLDGKDAAFTSGEIGKLYWGKVKSLTRNVLYIKPRTLLMLDVAVPTEEDADITLLYQTEHLADIKVGSERSSITKNQVSTHFMHLSPDGVKAQAVATPHYIRTLQSSKPLEREGMLTVTGRTAGRPLVMANLITTSALDNTPAVDTDMGDGYISGVVSGNAFVFSTRLDHTFQVKGISSDALAIYWSDGGVFVAKAKVYQDEKINIKSDVAVTFDFSSNNQIKYYAEDNGEWLVGLKKKPSKIYLNNQPVDFSYNRKDGQIKFAISKGEGIISFK